MVKKTKNLRRLSNSDLKIQRLYQEAITEIRDRNVAILEKSTTKSVKTNQAQKLPNKSGEKRDKTVYKSRKHDPGRGSLSIPVSKLLPFRYDPRGYHFPADFRKDDNSNAWIPRTADGSTFGSTSETTDSESSDGYSTGKVCENLCSDDEKVFDMDELLQVLPLRSTDDEDTGSLSSERSSIADPSLPPLYKRDIWREIIARGSTSVHSIPSKTGSSGTNSISLMLIGNEERLDPKQRRNKVRKIGLVERRARLRAVAASKAFKA